MPIQFRETKMKQTLNFFDILPILIQEDHAFLYKFVSFYCGYTGLLGERGYKR